MKIKESITISIPAFNEEKTIEEVAKQALNILSALSNDYEVFLINDGSTDRTKQIMNDLAKHNKYIKVVHHSKNRGFSAVITEGLFSPKTDLVLLAPADGQFNFSQVKKFISIIDKYDAVFGYRTFNAEPLSRKFQSLVYHILGKVLFGIKLREFSSIYLWRTSVLKGIKVVSSPRSNTAQMEIVYKAQKEGAKFGQVPIRWNKRKGGRAKGIINLILIFSTLSEILKLWWSVKNG